MRTGIQVSSLKPLLTTAQQVRSAFERLAEMGCSYVQLQWIDPTVPVEAIAQSLKETGLQAVSVQDYYTEVRKNTAYYTQLNQMTGGAWCCISRIPESMRTPAGMADCVREFRELAREVEQKHQKLCFHPVLADYQTYDGLVPVDYLMKNMPEMPLCLDLYHLNRSGRNMTEWIEARSHRICMVHFKEEKDGQLVPAGQGDTDWTGVAEACVRAGVEYAFVEQETWTRDPFECLQEALAWLNGQLQGEKQ